MKRCLVVVVVLLLARGASADEHHSVLELATPPTTSTTGEADLPPLPRGVRPKGDSGSSMGTWCLISLGFTGVGVGIAVGVDKEVDKGIGATFGAIGLVGALYTCGEWMFSN